MGKDATLYTNEQEELTFYRSFIQAMNGVMYVLNVYPYQVDWITDNEILTKMLGLNAKEVLNIKSEIASWLKDSPDYEESVEIPIKEFTKNPNIKWAGVYRLKDTNGAYQWVMYSAATISTDKFNLPEKIAVIALPLKDIFNTPKTLIEFQKHLSQNIYKKIINSLTERQKQVLSLIAQGFISKEIAHKLDISEYTVESHKEALYKKLSCTNKAELIKCAEKFGLT